MFSPNRELYLVFRKMQEKPVFFENRSPEEEKRGKREGTCFPGKRKIIDRKKLRAYPVASLKCSENAVYTGEQRSLWQKKRHNYGQDPV